VRQGAVVNPGSVVNPVCKAVGKPGGKRRDEDFHRVFPAFPQRFSTGSGFSTVGPAERGPSPRLQAHRPDGNRQGRGSSSGAGPRRRRAFRRPRGGGPRAISTLWVWQRCSGHARKWRVLQMVGLMLMLLLLAVVSIVGVVLMAVQWIGVVPTAICVILAIILTLLED